MKRIATLVLLGLMTIGCSKKPDSPVAQSAPATPTTPNQPVTPPPPPPVTNCQGATVMYTMPVDTIASNSIKTFVIPNFEMSCGDSVQVFFRNPGVPSGTPWTEIFDVPNGASYFSVTNQTVTVHNSAGTTLDVEITAVLK